MSILNFKRFSCKGEEIEKDETYKHLKESIAKIETPVDFKSNWVLNYVQQKFEYLRNDVEFIDKKADSLIRYLGLGTGGVGAFLAYLHQGQDLPCFISAMIATGVFFWVLSILHALIIRRPSNTAYPQSMVSLFHIENKYKTSEKDASLFALILSYEKAIAMQLIISERMAKRLRLSYVYLMIALTLFFVPLTLFFVLT